MGNGLSNYYDSNPNTEKNSQRITTIAPNYNNGEVDSTLSKQTLIPNLLEESEEKFKN
ncbi:hypothetical protein RhiirA1_408019, partial [Rhizophagus irregularis]